METTWQCACCGELNEVFIDEQAGSKQVFVEDCRICCRPNVITATFNEYRRAFDIATYQEDVG
jgi:hypothetical protein